MLLHNQTFLRYDWLKLSTNVSFQLHNFIWILAAGRFTHKSTVQFQSLAFYWHWRFVLVSRLTGNRLMIVGTTVVVVVVVGETEASCASIVRSRSSSPSRSRCSWISWRFKSLTCPETNTSSSELRKFVSESKHLLKFKFGFALSWCFCMSWESFLRRESWCAHYTVIGQHLQYTWFA